MTIISYRAKNPYGDDISVHQEFVGDIQTHMHSPSEYSDDVTTYDISNEIIEKDLIFTGSSIILGYNSHILGDVFLCPYLYGYENPFESIKVNSLDYIEKNVFIFQGLTGIKSWASLGGITIHGNLYLPLLPPREIEEQSDDQIKSAIANITTHLALNNTVVLGDIRNYSENSKPNFRKIEYYSSYITLDNAVVKGNLYAPTYSYMELSSFHSTCNIASNPLRVEDDCGLFFFDSIRDSHLYIDLSMGSNSKYGGEASMCVRTQSGFYNSHLDIVSLCLVPNQPIRSDSVTYGYIDQNIDNIKNPLFTCKDNAVGVSFSSDQDTFDSPSPDLQDALDRIAQEIIKNNGGNKIK